MKKFLKSFFALALTLCLLAGMGTAAFADEKNTIVAGYLGSKLSYSLELDKAAAGVHFLGECPGVTASFHDQSIFLDGTPSSVGGWTVQATVSYEDGSEDVYLIVVRVADAAETVIEADEAEGKPTVVGDGTLAITKHPTGESVIEGGTAIFVARADNATEILWRLVSPDASNTYTAAEAPSYFAGLSVEGLGTDTLTLIDIPLSLNGWYAEAKFSGKGGPLFSNGARIRVICENLPTPSISVQPQNVQLQNGGTATLSVKASVPAGELHYQWYRNTENKNSGGTAIDGATSSDYTPPESAGKCYYYVNVWCTDAERESTHVNSSVASVQYPEAVPTATPVPTTATGTQAPNQPNQTEGGTAAPAETEGRTEPEESASPTVEVIEPARQHSNTLLIVLILLLLAALITGCVLVLYLRRRDGDD